MSLTISPSPFGSLVVSVAETGSTLSVTTVATSPSVLSMALGVPGPAGEQGEPGANGQNGEGVPVGGTAGQVLAKIDGTNYNTEWVDAGAAGDFLPLAGGTMTGDITFSVDGNGNDSQIGPWGLGVENTNGQVAYIQPDVLRVYDNDHLTGTSVNGAGITFNDSTVQTTAYDPAVLGDYLPLSGGIMSGAIRFDSVGTQNIAKGSFDSGRGGYNGISLNCAVDYELNWQAGFLKSFWNGQTVPLNIESNVSLYGNIPEVGTATGVISGVTTYWEGGSNGTFNLSYAGVSGVTPNNIGDGTWSVTKDGVSGYNGDSWGLASDKVFSTKNTGWSFGDDGITFASDGSTQTTAGLPLNGSGIMTNSIVFEYNGFLTELSNIQLSFKEGSYGIGEDGNFYLGAWGQITFPDSTVQTTAYDPAVLGNYLPITGGTLEGNLNLNKAGEALLLKVYDNIDNNLTQIYGGQISLTDGGSHMGINGGGITFPDTSTQVTKGDRYKATSSTSNTVDNGNGKSFTTQPNLAYTPLQTCIIYSEANPTGNHMHCTVVSYNEETGVLVVDADTHTGSGTHTDWVINIG